MKTNYSTFLQKTKGMGATFIMVSTMFFSIQQVQAQVSAMNFQTIAGGYSTVVGGVTVGTATDDDNSYGANNIGFTFNYNGVAYTQFGINNNGWISMGAGSPANSYNPISTGAANNVISPFGRDLVLGYRTTGNVTLGSTNITNVGSITGISVGVVITGTGIPVGATVVSAAGTTVTISAAATITSAGTTLNQANGEKRIETIGVAPNRVCVIQWSKARPYGQSNCNFNFQIRLSETTDYIDVVYGTMFDLGLNVNAEVGLRGSSNADFNNRVSTPSWNSSTAGGTNAAFSTLSPFAYPGVGTDYNWLIVPTDLAVTALFAPVAGTTCLSNIENISVTVKNTGSQSINFANNPALISSASTGLNPMTFPVFTINNGTLAPGATQNIIVKANFDMSVSGVYTFTASSTMAGDGFAPNNAMPLATFTSFTPSVNAGPDVTICEGTSTNLNATANAFGVVNTTYTSNTVVNVPDGNPAGAIATVNCFGAPGNANQIVSATIDNFTHTWISDMRMRLIAPDGSSCFLILNRGGSGDNMTNTVFTTSAINPISAGVAPFTGSFRPETPFSGLTGVATGTWSLEMIDQFAGDIGTLNTWSLTFAGPNSIVSYAWSPALGLNNPAVANPIASPIVTTDYVVTVTDGNNCTKRDTVKVTVNPLPLTPAAISGLTNICEGQTNQLFVSSSTYATGYNWTVPTGATIVGNANNDSIYVDFAIGALSGNITVQGTNACGNSVTTTTLAITILPLVAPAGAISGNATVCENTTNIMYMVSAIANATGYNWTVPAGAIITAGANTTMITVDFPVGSISGNVTVAGTNSCGAGAASTFAVVVNPLPGTPGAITGSTTVCANSMNVMYMVPAIANATGYSWTVPSGAAIVAGGNTNMITVDFPFGSVSGNITVMGVNSCGNSITTSTLMVTIVDTAGAIGSITGPIAVCAGQMGVNFVVPTVTNAIGYNWSLPAGATIVAGANTNSIMVDFSNSPTSGNVTVYGYNTCDSSMVATLAITATQLLGNAAPITGLATVCQGQSTVVYTIPAVANATGYNWTVPTGATIVLGANTNSITVDYSNSALSGSVTAYATNSCFTGATVSLSVNVLPLPVAAFQYAFNGGIAGFVNNSTNGNTYVWTFGDGASDTVMSPIHTYTVNGTYTVKLVVTNGCGSDSITVVLNVNSVGISNTNTIIDNINVFPNPSNGIINIQITSQSSNAQLRIMDASGKIVYNERINTLNGQYNNTIDLSNNAKGVYSLQIITNNQVITKKVVLD